MGRRVFSREFKPEAVSQIVDRGVYAAQVARDIEAHLTLVNRWEREPREDTAQKSLPKAETDLKPGLTFLLLDHQANAQTDHQAAQHLQTAQRRLFQSITEQKTAGRRTPPPRCRITHLLSDSFADWKILRCKW